MSRARALVVVLMLIASAAIARAAVQSPPGSGSTLMALPFAINGWVGTEAPPLDAETLRILSADAVLNRTYTAGDGTPIGLYVAYYAKQRPGVSIHSPLHCLPGTGWEAVDVSTRDLGTPAAPGTVRRLIVRKNERRALVLYWYALHGRMIASEITSKFLVLADSIRLHRSDAALVRIVVPIGGSVSAADDLGMAFGRDLAPRLDDILY